MDGTDNGHDISFPRQGEISEEESRLGRHSIIPQCQNCIFRDSKNPAICGAFPGGIPTVILTNDFDHRHPWPGQQNDITFFPKNILLPFPISDDRK